MKVSVFNICTDALDMLKFSTYYATENAYNEFDYILILWNPSEEVKCWATSNAKVLATHYGDEKNPILKDEMHIYYYETKKDLDFIQNLRNCFNLGFEKSFEFNDYAAGINTDMCFYMGWLANLTKYAAKDSLINCRQIEPGVYPTLHETLNCGRPTEEEFEIDKFYDYCSQLYSDKLITEKEWKKRADATPHLMHKKIWEEFGPWDPKRLADVEFFNRCKEGGIKNMKSLGSLVYHFGRCETEQRERRGDYGKI